MIVRRSLYLLFALARNSRVSSFQAAPSGARRGSSSLLVAADALPDTRTPLSPNTFAGMVEKGLLERFEEKDIERVLASWRLLDQDYYHREYVGESGKEAESDMVQECHSYVPGLTIKPFWDAKDFDWAAFLEKKYPEIRKEFDRVNADMQKLKEQGNNIWAGALTEDASSYGEGWKTLVLMNRGRWDQVNVNLFPKTSKAVYDSGIPATEVFFACMSGPSEIKKHTDFTNFVLTSHLAVDIPYSGENKCRISVGDETREWINGNVMVFDTSLLHDAVNESDRLRYILMFRLWHPDLTLVERQALQFTYDCLEIPDLVSENPEERYMAEEIAKSVRAFPAVTSKTMGSGFGEKMVKEKKRKAKGDTKKGFGI